MTRKEKLELRFLVSDFAKARSKDSSSIGAICDALLKDVALLGKAWSEMATRNLISDMVRLVSRMEGDKTLTGTAKLRCIDVKKALNKHLNQHSPMAGRYESVVCVGYKFKCAGDKYAGKPDDHLDMIRRCENMKVAIRSAYALADTMGAFNTNKKVLKIFMAPEFFFRGRNGAYTHEIVHGREAQPDARPRPLPKVKGIMEVMREEIDRPEYKDWLFVLGTAIAATELVETGCKDCTSKVKFVPDTANPGKTKAVCIANPTHATGEKSLGAIVENVALVKKEHDTHTITKELVSGIDYVEDEALGKKGDVKVMGKRLTVHTTAQPSGYRAATNVPTKFQDERMGGSIFTVDGVTIGLEVCLDHAATRGSGTAGRLEHAANIQVQLIPSAGMSIGKLRTLPGGIVFNVDGLTPHVQVVAGATPEVQLSQPGRKMNYRYTGPTWDELAPVGTNTDSSEGTTLGDLGGSWGAPTAWVGSAIAGSVVGYGPYDLPRA